MGLSLQLTNQDLLSCLNLNDNVKFSLLLLVAMDSTSQYINFVFLQTDIYATGFCFVTDIGLGYSLVGFLAVGFLDLYFGSLCGN